MKFTVERAFDVWKAQRPCAIGLHGFHEGVENAHGDVEVGDGVLAGLAGDESLDVGVIYAQHAHVGAAPRSPLRNLPERAVVDPQEAHGPRRFPHAGKYQRGLGTQAGKGEAVAAAGLLDQRRVAQGLENPPRFLAHIVFDGQDETGRQLSQRRAGAGEGRRVGHESQLGQHGEKACFRFCRGAGVVFGGRDVMGDTVEHAGDRLRWLTALIAP